MTRYGGDHKAVRRALLPYAVGSSCPRCDRPILPGQPVELDHIDSPVCIGGGGRRALSHSACNARHGGRLGAARRNANRRKRVRTMLAEVALGIELAEDRGHASIAAAGLAGGHVVVELAAYLDGTGFVVAEVAALRAARTVLAVAVDPHSGAATLIKPLAAARITVTAPTTSDVVIAHGLFLDKLAAGELRHVSDPRLDAAVRYGVQRPLGGARAWERRGLPVDVAPLTAATLAAWALLNAPRFAPAEIF